MKLVKSSIEKGKVALDRPGLKGRIIYDRENAQAVVIDIAEGMELAEHKTPVDVFILVLTGRGIITVGGDKHEVMKDDIIDSPKMIPHGIVNTGEETLRVLVVKAPHP
ncbi:MAG: cupin domain-containing protein [Mesotoga sp.]|uniref:cupin domain-containing protein n=2 Tax=Mesotoga sp. TaxID=2053577 RepID=UPI0026319DBF|nr:cupin domain-containing protein [Mesotoga sp.]MDD2334680.1 cupin domain-containing protein [Mesotoga sp.]MDD4208103.1 cupin domain-containing protein [Mesotoga sp.]MDD4826586.1 cupin domain-containing protein [Mesotoga sp.]MDD5683481.1 cupin domain-containing protein [Mesotoga sp.]